MGAVKSLVLAAEEGDATAAATLRRLSATEALAVFAGTLGPAVDAGWDQVGETDCPACHGEGGYEVIVGGWDEPIYEGRECPSCCGTGKAPVVAFTVRLWEPLADAPRREPVDLDDAHLPLVDLPF